MKLYVLTLKSVKKFGAYYRVVKALKDYPRMTKTYKHCLNGDCLN